MSMRWTMEEKLKAHSDQDPIIGATIGISSDETRSPVCLGGANRQLVYQLANIFE